MEREAAVQASILFIKLLYEISHKLESHGLYQIVAVVRLYYASSTRLFFPQGVLVRFLLGRQMDPSMGAFRYKSRFGWRLEQWNGSWELNWTVECLILGATLYFLSSYDDRPVSLQGAPHIDLV